MAICYSNDCGGQVSDTWTYLQEAICDGIAAQSDYQSVLANATIYARPADQFNGTGAIYYPIIFSPNDVQPTIQSVGEFRNQLYYGQLYGGATLVVALIFIVLGMINNLYHVSISRWTVSPSMKSNSLVSKANIFFRKVLINPALFPNGAHSRPKFILGIRITIPTRIESVAIGIFLLINVLVLIPNYRLFSNNVFWPNDTAVQLCRYVADRSGIIAFTQLPLIFLFAGRNNLLLYLTGWSYDRFNVAHKWVSRTMFFHAAVHALAYTWYRSNISQTSLYQISSHDLYYQCGMAAVIIGALILMFSMPTFRRLSYEIFLAGHIIMVVAFSIGLWFHIDLIPLDEYLPWIGVSLSLWCLDRIIRFARIFYLNVAISSKYYQECIAEVLPEECIRLRIRVSPKILRTLSPGAYVYIYVPSIYFWQSHPFTVAGWTELEEQGSYLAEPVQMQNLEAATSEPYVPESTFKPHPGSGMAAGRNYIELLVRPKTGLTHRLYNKILQHKSPLQLSIIVEGPYGHTAPISQYDTVIYIAGGVGVSAPLSYLQQAVRVHRGTTRHIVFIWVVRTSQALAWIQDELCRILVDTKLPLTVDFELYVTKDTKSGEIPMPLTSSVHFGERPDIPKRIHNHVALAPASVAVLACGPPSMNDEVRSAVSKEGIVYFEEAFTW
ncbi:ferric-chelate reductase Frp1 [Umbelopsis nana]